MNIILNGKNLTIDKVIAVARYDATVKIEPQAIQRILESQAFIKSQVEQGKIVYGVTTGFGPNADTVVPPKYAEELQYRLLISHATGVGKPIGRMLTRAMMVIRLNTLLAGHSGIRLQTVQLFQSLLNHKIHPIIPSQGSVGASGDLCPQSHMALPVMGVGEVEYLGTRMLTEQLYELPAIKRLNEQIKLTNTDLAGDHPDFQATISPMRLSYKEGLAFNNGTALMAALGVIGTYKTHRLIKGAVASMAMTFEALCARTQAFQMPIHAVRRHESQLLIAEHIRNLTKGSTLMGLEAIQIVEALPVAIIDKEFLKVFKKDFPIFKNIETLDILFKKETLQQVFAYAPKRFLKLILRHIEDATDWRAWNKMIELAIHKLTPQDAYSVRCTPQVIGASLEALRRVERTIAAELNAVVDNPIIFLKGQKLPNGEEIQENHVLSGGNFHGQPLAVVLDHLKLAIAEIGSLLERQINKLVDKATNERLPPFLAENAGLNSGLMIPQYVAAALVSENKTLVHPASADSIPTSANQEDHVSMGPIAGRQALEILKNVEKILAIHLITGKQAIMMREKQFENKLPVNISTNADAIISFLDNIGIKYYDIDRLLYTEIEWVIDSLEKYYDLVNKGWEKPIDKATILKNILKELNTFDIESIEHDGYLFEDLIRITEKVKRLKQI